MALLSTERVLPLLVCPRCRSPLLDPAGATRCSSPGCALAREGAFPRVGTHPALVDFERSILDRDVLVRTSGHSLVARAERRGPKKWLQNLYDPPNHVAEQHARDLLERLRGRTPRPIVLVVGGGTVGKGAGAIYESTEVDVIAFDIYASPWTQFIADAHQLPLPDASVDAVWVQAVLEHVLDPWQAAAEIARVLKDRGLVYAETPFMQQVHEGPFDFTRFTESGHRWLFRRFERIDSGVVAGPGNQLSWTLDHVTRGVFRSIAAGRAMRLLTFWTHALDGVIPERFAVDGASCVFFFGAKSERDIPPAEMVTHYRGAQRP